LKRDEWETFLEPNTKMVRRSVWRKDDNKVVPTGSAQGVIR